MPVVAQTGGLEPDPIAVSAEAFGVEQFFGLISQLFDGLKAPSTLLQRIDSNASRVAADLLRRTRRRRAVFDLFLNEAPLSYADDLALAVQAQQGSADSVLEIRRRLEPVVLKRIYSYNLGWNEEELIDLVFDRVAKQLPTYRGKASLRTWAGTVAKNALINWIRSEAAKPAHVPIGTADRQLVADGEQEAASPVMAAERSALLKRLAGQLSAIALEVLSPSQWELLQRQIIDGESYQQLSDESGKSPEALRKRRFDAIKKLRAAVIERYGKDFSLLVQETLGDA